MKSLLMITALFFAVATQAEPMAPNVGCAVWKENGNLPIKDKNWRVNLKTYTVNPLDGKPITDKIDSENLEYTIDIGYVNNGDGKPVKTKNDIVMQATLTVDGYEVDTLADTYRPHPGRFGVSLYNSKTKISYGVDCFK